MSQHDDDDSEFTAYLRSRGLVTVAEKTNGAAGHATPAIPGLLTGIDLDTELPELEYLVRAIGLNAGSGPPHLIAGYGFSGKTVALQAALVSLVGDRPVWGVHGASRPFRAIHVDLEQGRRVTQRRYQRLARAMNVSLSQLGEAIAVVVHPGITLRVEDEARWIALMSGRDVMVVDSLRASMPGVDENSSDIRAGLDLLGKWSEKTNCRVIVIHHARKPSEGSQLEGRYSIRGSGGIYDACDSIYVFTAKKGEPVAVEHVKAREHGELEADFSLVISDVPSAEDPKWGLRVQVHGIELVTEARARSAKELRDAQAKRDSERISSVLTVCPGVGSEELKARAGLSGGRYSEAVRFLGARLQIREEKSGRSVRRCHYIVTTGQPDKDQT